MSSGLLSVIVVSFNTRELLSECLASLVRLEPLAYEAIVIDNASSDGSAEMVATGFPWVRLIRSAENLGFGRANNLGMQAARGDCFLLLNSDARLIDGSLRALVEELRADETLGVLGPKLRTPGGQLQPSAYRFSSFAALVLEELALYKLLSRRRRAELLLGGYWGHDLPREADWLVGACWLLRRPVFERTGGFDPSIFLYGEEEEWCVRIRAAAFAVRFSPVGEVEHVGHASAHDLLGLRGRVTRCLDAADHLIAARSGRVAATLVPLVRVMGSVIRATYFGLRRLWVGAWDDQGRLGTWTARVVLAHYLRPMRRR